MIKAEWLQKLPYFFLYALVFILPFSHHYATICIICFSLTWLVTTNYTALLRNLKAYKIVWAFIVYFLLYVISYFYSSDKAISSLDLQTKLSILLFPIMIGCGLPINKKVMDYTFLSFISGITIAAITSVALACGEWLNIKDSSLFFYHSLVKHFDISAVYMSLYTFLSIGLLIIYKWKNHFKRHARILRFVLILIQLCFFFLLSARMLIALLIVFLIPYSFFYYLLPKLKKAQLYFVVISFISIIGILFLIDNPIKDRYNNVLDKDISVVTLQDYSNVSMDSFSNFTIRLFMWRVGLETIIDNNLWYTGSGNGDAQKLINNKLNTYKIQNSSTDVTYKSPIYNVNLHNMYLQTLISIGILGVIVILLISIYPFLQFSVLLKSPWYLFFFISTLFFMLQESLLQTQSGTVYYTLIYSLFINFLYKNRYKSTYLK